MASVKSLLHLLFLVCVLQLSPASAFVYNWSSSQPHRSALHGIELPAHPLSFNAAASSVVASGCDGHQLDVAAGSPEEDPEERRKDTPALKVHLTHRSARDPDTAAAMARMESLGDSALRDGLRIQTLFRRIREKKNQNSLSRLAAASERRTDIMPELGEKAAVTIPPELAGRMMATLESGVSLGSGEYFMDVFVGTPPRHLSLILDTGSDLNWIQCLPCHDCFEQHGPVYDPAASSSYRNVSCADPRCRLVSSPDLPRPCDGAGQPCPYFYWYGDQSNTTGDLALETFTVNLTEPDGSGATEPRRVDNVMFGCGHWNRGLFHGAAGLLGLGRGPLSFTSQLRSLYGDTFSYCLVDRNSDLSVSSKLIFGEDETLLKHPNLNYTSFVAGKENPADTFYYVEISHVLVGGERLDIPPATWQLTKDGSGGTIVDSGTTLSYFADPAYPVIKEAFLKKVKSYPLVEDRLVLSPCFNVSGVERVELPEFSIVFGDGAVWDFPPENYFVRLDPEEVVCLAILPAPKSSSFSILGNYQQQNFHVVYDLKHSRLGFAPMQCAEV